MMDLVKKETFLYSPCINKSATTNIWMAFPGPESFAMSSLGYLWLFKNLDELQSINVERIYADTKSTIFSVQNVSMIGFSFTFDTDFMNIFSMLDKYNIPLKSKDRDDNYPIIFAGGPVVTANPAPYKEIFDFVVVGDGESANIDAVKIYKQMKPVSKIQFLKKISEFEGIYVPTISNKVKKCTKKIEECVYTPIISERAFFPNTFIMEIARGCSNRCGFCIASYLNLPLRFVPYDKIIQTIELGLKYTNKIALLGAQLSAHPQFKNICEYIYSKIKEGKQIEMSVSSLRVDAITPEVIKVMKACGQHNLTLAIEAGSERLRKVINKNLTREQIFNAVDIAHKNGLKGLKFYGMLGLPTETYDDINEMIKLAKELKAKYRGFDITFGVSTFVPKPNTPFQWIGRENSVSLEKKAEYLKKEMHKIGVKVNISSVKWDYWQAVLSRGDEKITDFLIEVWKDKGKLGAYKKAAKQLNINTDYYAYKNWNFDDKLPWDFIELKPDKDFLINENKKLFNI